MNNIKKLRKAHGLSMKKLADMCDVSEATISRVENDSRKPSFELLLKLGEALDCSVAELVGEIPQAAPQVDDELARKFAALDGHGKRLVMMILNAEYERCIAAEPEIVTIRHYLYSPAAGVNGLVSGEDYEDIPLPADAPDGADYCLTVSGDSMEPYIHDGQLVYVKEDEELHDFDVGVFFVDGSTYVKQFCRMYNGQIGLLSANPDREDANIYIRSDSTSSLVCLGKVLMKRPPAPQYT